MLKRIFLKFSSGYSLSLLFFFSVFETVEVFERSILASLWEHQQHVNVVVGDSAAAGLFYVCVFSTAFLHV